MGGSRLSGASHREPPIRGGEGGRKARPRNRAPERRAPGPRPLEDIARRPSRRARDEARPGPGGRSPDRPRREDRDRGDAAPNGARRDGVRGGTRSHGASREASRVRARSRAQRRRCSNRVDPRPREGGSGKDARRRGGGRRADGRARQALAEDAPGDRRCWRRGRRRRAYRSLPLQPPAGPPGAGPLSSGSGSAKRGRRRPTAAWWLPPLLSQAVCQRACREASAS